MKIYYTFLIVSTLLGVIFLLKGFEGLDLSMKQTFLIGVGFGFLNPVFHFCYIVCRYLLEINK